MGSRVRQGSRVHEGHLTGMRKRPAGRAALLAGGAAVLGCVIAGGAIAGCAIVPGGSPRPGAPITGAAATSPAATSTATGYYTAQVPASGQHHATLTVVTGAATVTVTAAAIPGNLVRVLTPGNAAIRPQLISSTGQVQLSLLSTGQHGPSTVSVQLSTAVIWQLQFNGGTGQTVVNLTNGKIAGIDFTAGSSLIQLALPRPAGMATITLAGGASQVSLTVPAGVPTRLRLDGGASAATLTGQAHTGLGRGTVLMSPGWPQAANRYDVDATAGIGEISVAG